MFGSHWRIAAVLGLGILGTATVSAVVVAQPRPDTHGEVVIACAGSHLASAALPAEGVLFIDDYGCQPPQVACIRNNCDCGAWPKPQCCDGTCVSICVDPPCCPAQE